MENRYEVIDETNWKRSLHCQIFRNSIEPCYCVTFELDVTNFLAKVRAADLSFTLSLIFVVAKCANGIEEFRYRFLDGQIVLYAAVNTAFTYLAKGDDLFKVVRVEMQETLERYVSVAAQKAADQKNYFTGPLDNDVFQFSPMPWVSYTHISHTNSGKKDNAVPLFDWGRFFDRDGKKILPFSVQVHHSFVDGIHIGRLAESLQDYLHGFKL